MALVVQNTSVAERLVSSITGKLPNDRGYAHCRDRALKGLRDQSNARLSHTDIQIKCDGLIEKFEILNREDLACALRARLDELPAKHKCLPELLSFLLQLSDRPLEKTNLEDLEGLNRHGDEPPALTWQDILADDPPAEDGLWEDVERGYHSSADEATIDEVESENTISTQATSVHDKSAEALANLHIVQPDNDGFHGLRQAHRHAFEGKVEHHQSELTILRETLAMLRGLPTYIHIVDDTTGQVSLKNDILTTTASQSVFVDLSLQFTAIGSSLNSLRISVRNEQQAAHIQSCQAAIQRKLHHFEANIEAIESRLLKVQERHILSLINAQATIDTCAKPLVSLAKILHLASQRQDASVFTLLDELYDGTCFAQMSGDTSTFNVLVDVLLAGLQTYLKPISTWVRSGTLPQPDAQFCVAEAELSCGLENLWHDRYHLRYLASGRLFGPSFMEEILHRSFALGKSQAFLHALGHDTEDQFDVLAHQMPLMPVACDLDAGSLLPFPQVLSDALESWIDRAATRCTGLLRQKLEMDHGLMRTLRGIEYIYCSKDGRRFQAFSDTLFWRMDQSKSRWHDRFLLSELAQTTLGSSKEVEATNLSICLTTAHQKSKVPSSTIRQIEDITLEYFVTWPIQNIIHAKSPSMYSTVFKVLLQLYRAKFLLRATVLDMRTFNSRRGLVSNEIAAALRLQQQLLWVVDVLHCHITSTAHVLNRTLHKHMEEAGDIDAMTSIWADHTKRFEANLLTAPGLSPVKEALVDMLELCESFSNSWRALAFGSIPSAELSDDESEGSADETVADDAQRLSMSKLQIEFGKTLSFFVAGLRSIGRAGGHAALEVLAEQLRWNADE